jgi:hypothetical protein
MNPNDFHPRNTASELLAKIGYGTADADFARGISQAVTAAQATKKKAKVVLTVEIDPRDEVGSLVLRADVVTKCPKLPAPASQMHMGPRGELLTQQEFILGGGPEERPAPLPAEKPAATSGRLTVAAVAAPAPLAAAPKPAPLAGDGGPIPHPIAAGKDAGAGKDD